MVTSHDYIHISGVHSALHRIRHMGALLCNRSNHAIEYLQSPIVHAPDLRRPHELHGYGHSAMVYGRMAGRGPRVVSDAIRRGLDTIWHLRRRGGIPRSLPDPTSTSTVHPGDRHNVHAAS